jgi:hypothetical protein
MKLYLLLIGLCFTVITCKKDDIETDIESIIIGSESNLLVNSYDIILHGTYNVPASIDLDVNMDNEPDYRLLSEIKSTSLSRYSQASIFCLSSNCLINGYLNPDTMYLYTNTDTSYEVSTSKVNIMNDSIYSCVKYNEQDMLIITPDVFSIIPKSKGINLLKNEIFKSDTISLSAKYPVYQSTMIVNNDTTIYNRSIYYSSCNSFPSNSIIYIGIKITDHEIEKIGWIKLSVIDGLIITIIKSAIQQ